MDQCREMQKFEANLSLRLYGALQVYWFMVFIGVWISLV